MQTLIDDPNQWAIQTGDYANQRYSELDQINKDNVKDLQVAWTFSTGVLRGHEGSPLVIGDIMYVHSPFPNIVYALDLNNDGKILWKYEPKQDPNVIPVMCCDTVNRGVAYADGKIFLHQADTTVVALDAQDRRRGLEREERRSGQGRDQHRHGDAGEGQADRRHLGRRVRRARVGDRLQHRRRHAGLARLFDRAGQRHADRPGEDHASGQAGRRRIPAPTTWEGDQWKIGGGTTWGWYSYDPELNLIYYGTGNPSTWNPAQRPATTAGR